MSNSQDPPKYGHLSWFQWIRYKFHMTFLPLYLGWKIISSPFVKHNQERSLHEIVTHAKLRYLLALDPAQVQYHCPPCLSAYNAWANHNDLPQEIEELEEDTKVVWIGPKTTEKVIFYCHGGAYWTPLLPEMMTFWRYVQLEFEKRGLQVGVACLVYTLIPEAAFPHPLQQATIAINHLLASGVDADNLQLAGDSAGGNLVLQLLSHVLHPHPRVQPLRTSRFRGAYAMSPWVILSLDREHDGGESLIRGDHADILTRAGLKVLGDAVMKDVPPHHGMYAEPIKAPHGWFGRVGEVVDKILISTGEYDCCEDQARDMYEVLRTHADNVEFLDQEGGVHDGPYLELRPEELDDAVLPSSSITPAIIEWFAKGFNSN
ncbi:hypothetical protein PM082_020077 [Marasmius tenuissimus]|nr:hypothetical protein PM082_020077 [Marasmius tenuissimus]